ncbi:MAG: hypothetical protein K6A42_04380 [Treponema sp.]|nr:hypothetical protein [Treponema sp.]
MDFNIPISWNWKKDFLSDRDPAKLEREIKDSDFLVADAKGTHRMVGLKYDAETMNAPMTTCICMNFEMALAKSIAFRLGKMIFYDDVCSASLFNKARGESIAESDYYRCAVFYAKYICAAKLR